MASTKDTQLRLTMQEQQRRWEEGVAAGLNSGEAAAYAEGRLELPAPPAWLEHAVVGPGGVEVEADMAASMVEAWAVQLEDAEGGKQYRVVVNARSDGEAFARARAAVTAGVPKDVRQLAASRLLDRALVIPRRSWFVHGAVMDAGGQS